MPNFRVAGGRGLVDAGRWHQLKPRLRIAQALSGQRVRAQVRVRAAVVQARSLLQLFKHSRRATGVKPAAGHDAKANPVGLALHVARKIKLRLRRQRLPASHQRVGRLRVFARRQRAQNHCANHPRRRARLLGDKPRNVPLRDVAHLVAQHRRQLVGAAHNANQAQMHAEVAARQCKRVHAAVAD